MIAVFTLPEERTRRGGQGAQSPSPPVFWKHSKQKNAENAAKSVVINVLELLKLHV